MTTARRHGGLGSAAEGGRAGAGHPGLDDAGTGRGGGLPAGPRARAARRPSTSSCSPPAPIARTPSRAWARAPTTTSPSRSTPPSCGPGWAWESGSWSCRGSWRRGSPSWSRRWRAWTQLHGILPICSYCKKVRNDSDSWQQVEAYVSAHSAVRFNHGVCPECTKTVSCSRSWRSWQRARARREGEAEGPHRRRRPRPHASGHRRAQEPGLAGGGRPRRHAGPDVRDEGAVPGRDRAGHRDARRHRVRGPEEAAAVVPHRADPGGGGERQHHRGGRGPRGRARGGGLPAQAGRRPDPSRDPVARRVAG